MHSLRQRALRAALSVPASALGLSSSSSVLSSLSSAPSLQPAAERLPTYLLPSTRQSSTQPPYSPPAQPCSSSFALHSPFPHLVPGSIALQWRPVAPVAPPCTAATTPSASPDASALPLHQGLPPLLRQQQQQQGQWRGFSTSVGQGSGGRAQGPGLHEPPETHPFSVKGLNHIALAVPNLARAAEHYRTVFGAQVSDPHALPHHGVTVVFVHVGSTTIELLEPLGDKSPISKFLHKHPKGGLHHLCFTVDNIEVAAQHIAQEGVNVLGDYSERKTAGDAGAGRQAGEVLRPQIGAHGNPVVFLDPKDNLGVLCELEQVYCHER